MKKKIWLTIGGQVKDFYYNGIRRKDRVRRITKFNLHSVSFVSNPVNPHCKIGNHKKGNICTDIWIDEASEIKEEIERDEDNK